MSLDEIQVYSTSSVDVGTYTVILEGTNGYASEEITFTVTIIDCSDYSHITTTPVSNQVYAITTSPMTISIPPFLSDELLCGPITYSASFTQTSSITFDSSALTINVYSREVSLSGVTDTITISGSLTGGGN